MDDKRDMALRDELLRLETALAERDEAAIDGGYGALLHDAFEEIGASGRHWSRAETIAALTGAPTRIAEIRAFSIASIADGVVVATYGTDGDRPARRSSIWVWSGGRWQLRFHQGTLA